MINYADKLRTYFDAYENGIYTGDETIDATIALLVDSRDFSGLWGEIPDWAKLRISTFLNSCDETSLFSGSSPISNEHVSPDLIVLKNWVMTAKGGK